MGESITIATYNILHPEFALRHKTLEGLRILGAGAYESNWPERRPQIAANLTGADLVCLQETDVDMTLQVSSAFNQLVYAPHVKDGKAHCHGTALLAKPEAGTKMQGFCLTPEEENTRSLAGMFFKLASGRHIIVASVHPDGYSDGEKDTSRLEASKEAGYSQLDLWVRQLEQYKPCVDAILVAGDFNEHFMPPGTQHNRHVLMARHGYQEDGSLTSSEPSTGRKLDWVYVWSRKPVTLEPVLEDVPHPQASDHLPVRTRLVWG